MNYELIKELHAKYNGLCQNCKQSCDKRVISVVSDKIYCPDCTEQRERPTFKPTDNIINMYAKRTDWDKEQIKAYLKILPYGMGLVHHDLNTRTYWDWDKNHDISRIETDHEGNFLHFTFRKIDKTFNIKDIRYKINTEHPLNLKKIVIPDEFIKHPPNLLKVKNKIEEYKEHGSFKKPVYVTDSQQPKKFLLVDGYTSYLALKDLKVNHVHVAVIEKVN